MGRPAKGESYENILNKWNKEKKKVICECGKSISENLLEKHQTTQIHTILLHMKAKLFK
jgi:hypothetical protein